MTALEEIEYKLRQRMNCNISEFNFDYTGTREFKVEIINTCLAFYPPYIYEYLDDKQEFKAMPEKNINSINDLVDYILNNSILSVDEYGSPISTRQLDRVISNFDNLSYSVDGMDLIELDEFKSYLKMSKLMY